MGYHSERGFKSFRCTETSIKLKLLRGFDLKDIEFDSELREIEVYGVCS